MHRMPRRTRAVQAAASLAALVAILAVALLAPASAATYDVRTAVPYNFSAAEQDQLYRLANTSDSGALQPWVNMPQGVRTASTPDVQYVFDTVYGGFTGSGGDLRTFVLAVLNSIAGLITIFILCIIFAILACCTCPFFYWCRSCGCCGGARPTKLSPYTDAEKRDAVIVLVVGLILVSVGGIIGIFASVQMAKGIDGVLFSVDHTINDAKNLPIQVVGLAYDLVDQLNDTVTDIANNLKDAPTSFIVGQITPYVFNLTAQISALQIVFDDIYNQLDLLDTTSQDTLDTITLLKTNFDDVQAQYAALLNYYSFNTFSYRIVCLPPVPNRSFGIPTFPDGKSLLSYVDTFNLTAEAINIENNYNSFSDNVLAQIDDTIDDIVGEVTPKTTEFLDQAVDSVNGIAGSINGILNDIQGTIRTYNDQYVAVANYWRNVGMCIIFSFVWIVMLLAIFGISIKISCLVTFGAVLAFTLMWILWYFAAFQYIIAVPIGLVCKSIDSQAITQVIPSQLNVSFVDDYVPIAYEIIDTCTQPDGNLANVTIMGSSLIGVIQPLRAQFDDAINQLNLTGLIESIDIAGQIGDLDVAGKFNLTGYQGYLDNIASANYDEPIGLVNQTYLDVQGWLVDYDVLSTVPEPVPDSCLEYSGATPTGTDLNDVKNDARARINSAIAALNTVSTVDLPALRDNINLLASQTATLSTKTAASAPVVFQLSALALNATAIVVAQSDAFLNSLVQTVVPAQIALARTFVNSAIDQVIGLADCYFVGQDYLAFKNSICVLFVGGLDAVWWACGYVATLLIIVIVGLTLTAKRIILSAYIDDGLQDVSYVDTEMATIGGSSSAAPYSGQQPPSYSELNSPPSKTTDEAIDNRYA